MTDKNTQTQKGFGVIGFTLVILVITFVSFAGYMVYQNQSGDEVISNNSSKSDDASNSSAESSKQTLQKLSADFEKLNPATNNNQGADVAVDFYAEKLDGNEDVISVSLPSKLYVNFTSDTKAILQDMQDIMSTNGFETIGETISDDNVYLMATYSNKDSRCNFYSSVFYGRITCTSQAELDYAKAQFSSILGVIKDEKGLKPTKAYIDWITSPTDENSGVKAYYADSATDTYSYPSMYIYRTSSSDWQFTAEAKRGTQQELPPSCEDLNQPSTREIFANVQCE